MGGYKEAQTESGEQKIVKNCVYARGFIIFG